MSINIYPSIAKVKRNGVYENLPGFVQQSGNADIEAMIATKESASIAQYAHPQGSYFILNDVLYQADDDIPVSGTIAVGTNCHVAILADNLENAENDVKDLKSSITPLNLIGETIRYTAASGYQNVPVTIAAGEYKVTAHDCGVTMKFRNASNEEIDGLSIYRYADGDRLTITSAQASQIAYLRMYGGYVDIYVYPDVLEKISNLQAEVNSVEKHIDFDYTDNDVLNANIKECKVEIFNNTINSIRIEIPENVTTYLYVKTFNSGGTQIESKNVTLSVWHDPTSNLFLISTSDFRIRMILTLDFLSSTHAAYVGTFQSSAYGHSVLFDEQNYPYDKHITGFSPTSSGDPLSAYMKLRDAIKEIYLNSKSATSVTITDTGYFRLLDGETSYGSVQLQQNYVGTIWYGDYCGIYIDTTNIYGLSLANVSITKTNAVDNPNMSSQHIFYCGANRALSTLKAGIEAAEQYMDSILYVDDGTYNLITEFGSDYFANLPDTDQQAGIKLKNRIHVIFGANSVVTAHYTGDNENVCTCFSPFNNGVYGFTLENLTLFASRVRYGVHDVGGTTHNSSKYLNCHIEIDNSNNEYWNSECAIGAGLGSNQDTEVSGCVFAGQVYWHLTSDTSITDYRGTVQCVNCYFINNTIQVSASRTDAQIDTEFVFTGNSLKKLSASDADGIIRRAIVQDASAVIRAWNNEART